MQFRKKILGGIAAILAASTLTIFASALPCMVEMLSSHLQVISHTIRPLRHIKCIGRILQSLNTNIVRHLM